ncbi:MAG TPA: PspC domain-containing protein [Burkholderiaceae bacterium]|jgi:phage shock protein PspC (stress-responsive transcriptional regulator)
MINTEELGKLADLHQRGALTDEEFAQAKARILSGESAHSSAGSSPSGGSAAHAINTFHRSRTDRWIGGVCGGVGELTGVASWIWRLIFAALMMCAGTGVLFYILLWIFVPEE